MRRIMPVSLGATAARHRRCGDGMRDTPGYYRGRHVSATLPMFPLGSVLFPGVIVPLRVFEDRYRALVHHLIREPDPAHRLFGSVGIREGYEVGDHGAQSLFRVGCRLQLTDVEAHEDGTFDIVAVGRDRIRLDRLDTTGPFPAGEVATMPPAESVGRPRGDPSGPWRCSRPTGPPSRPTGATRTRATCRGTRRTCPGRWPPSHRWPCPTGRRCWSPTTRPAAC